MTQRIDLSHAVDAVAQSLHTTVLRTSEADDLFVQLVAAAVVRASEPHIVYRYTGADLPIRRRLGLTVGDWTITTAAYEAVICLLRKRVAGMAATDAQIRLAADSALRAALSA